MEPLNQRLSPTNRPKRYSRRVGILTCPAPKDFGTAKFFVQIDCLRATFRVG